MRAHIIGFVVEIYRDGAWQRLSEFRYTDTPEAGQLATAEANRIRATLPVKDRRLVKVHGFFQNGTVWRPWSKMIAEIARESA